MTAKSTGKMPRPLLIAVRTYEEFEQLVRVLTTAGEAAHVTRRADVAAALAPIIEQFVTNHVWETYNCGDPTCEACNGQKVLPFPPTVGRA